MQNQPTPSLLAKLAFPLLAVAAAACGGAGDISGRLGATRFGDLSNPPAERVPPSAPLSEACGAATVAGGDPSAFLRRPYLQRVGAGAADLLWVSAANPPLSAALSTPDGTIVAHPSPIGDDSARVTPGTAQWTIPIEGLSPSTVYCYELGDGTGAPIRGGFRTPPAPGAGAPVRFVAFGDSGQVTADQAALLQQMRTVPFDFLIHTGDIAYESGTREELEQSFFDVYAELLVDYPIFPASGNHEYVTEDATPFREVFDLPRNGGPEGLERWYSYDWGDVHFVVLDTERTGPVQARWLDEDLGANRLPWTIVYAHRPPFSSGYHGNDLAFRTHFVPVLEKHQVPLVLNGHDHDYERTKPQNGVTYVVTGGGGRGVKDVGASDFTAFSEAVIHFLYITVEGDRLALHAIDGLGQEFDSLILRRPAAR